MPITFWCQHLESKIAAVLLPPTHPTLPPLFFRTLKFFCMPAIHTSVFCTVKTFSRLRSDRVVGFGLKKIYMYLLVDHNFCSDAFGQACKSIDNPLPFLRPHLGLPSTAVRKPGEDLAAALALASPPLLPAGTDSFALPGPSALLLFSLRPPKIFEPKSLFFFPPPTAN